MVFNAGHGQVSEVVIGWQPDGKRIRVFKGVIVQICIPSTPTPMGNVVLPALPAPKQFRGAVGAIRSDEYGNMVLQAEYRSRQEMREGFTGLDCVLGTAEE